MTITEAEAERMADRLVWARLATDFAYRNADSAGQQRAREDQIESEVWAELESKYDIRYGA